MFFLLFLCLVMCGGLVEGNGVDPPGEAVDVGIVDNEGEVDGRDYSLGQLISQDLPKLLQEQQTSKQRKTPQLPQLNGVPQTNNMEWMQSSFSTDGGDCGYPGEPAHGTLSYSSDYKVGEVVRYSCEEGFVMFGPQERTCTENGTWTDSVPLCRLNVAVGQPSLQSETLWSYEPGLATDGDLDTCSFTPRTTEQRWWQVHLSHPSNIEAVAVAISPGSFQKFTIFVIELLEGNKALYKPCSKFEGTFESARAVFLCNDGQGHPGQFVYIRDDREEQEYFGLCEVQVFPYNNVTDCGSPEEPLGSKAEREGGVVRYSCELGFTMEGEGHRRCGRDGFWTGHAPLCREVECIHPDSSKNGYIEVSNFKGRYQFGSVATYRCNPGFILWGNGSRVCDSSGSWSGSPPSCKPITCGNPPQLDNSVVDLMNGSTTWLSVARYSCLPGFYIQRPRVNSSFLLTVCTKFGVWEQMDMKCVFDPNAVSFNFKKGRSLEGWSDTSGEINIGTIAAIGVISSLILLTIIIVIIVVSHRRMKQTQSNSRKISRSSTNQLLPGELNDGEECKEKRGVVVYDDLNAPHVVESDHNIIMDKFSTHNTLYHNTRLTTFQTPTPPESVMRSPVPQSKLDVEQRSSSRSPSSERSAGDGGSDREGDYSSVEDPYSQVRRPNGQAVETPYSSIGSVRRKERINDGYETLEPNYETLGIESSQVKEQVYETLRKHSSGYETVQKSGDVPDYETIQKSSSGYETLHKSVSSGTTESSDSQNTVRGVTPPSPNQKNILAASSPRPPVPAMRSRIPPSTKDADVMALYAIVDRTKKAKNRNSDSSLSPLSPGETKMDLSPTKSLIDKFNNIGQTEEIKSSQIQSIVDQKKHSG